MKKLEIAYIGGGSRGWAWNLMNDLVIEGRLEGTVRLFDIDHEASRINERIGNLYNSAVGAATEWKYISVETIDEALDGADFVIISILPGTFDNMENDVHYPEKYGIYQAVGDTVGPGGIMRSVRAVPMYRDIAWKVRKICPDAYIISYTNPMTILTKTLFDVFPDIKAFGCCHEVFCVQRLVAGILELSVSEGNVDRKEIETNVLGINHFTWIDRMEFKGESVMDIYKDFAESHLETGYCEKGSWDDSFFTSGNRVKFDLMLKYGIAAAAGDRHLAEFCPDRYLRNPKTAANWQFSLTPVSWRKKDRLERIKKAESLFKGEMKPVLSETGEEGVGLIKALSGLSVEISNVNTINKGQHEGLPENCVVETNAEFSIDGIKPVYAGRLPAEVEKMVQKHVINQENLVRACIDENRHGVQEVFLNDPMVRIRKDKAIKLFNEMFRMNSGFWD